MVGNIITSGSRADKHGSVCQLVRHGVHSNSRGTPRTTDVELGKTTAAIGVVLPCERVRLAGDEERPGSIAVHEQSSTKLLGEPNRTGRGTLDSTSRTGDSRTTLGEPPFERRGVTGLRVGGKSNIDATRGRSQKCYSKISVNVLPRVCRGVEDAGRGDRVVGDVHGLLITDCSSRPRLVGSRIRSRKSLT